MGLLRVLLALSVLLGHAGGFGGYIAVGGPLAVQCFYIISGFYMGLVLNERYDRPALNRTFYLNRAIRIYSLYFVFLALHLLLFALVHWQTGESPLDPYFGTAVSPLEKIGLGLLNVTVIGQDIPLFLRAEEGHLVWSAQFLGSGEDEVFHFMAIPAAWSLSLELCFYLLAPWIVRRPTRDIALLLILSLGARVAAAAYGIVADPFSYRFFPFELALFLAGSLSYRAWAARRELWQRPAMRLLAAAVPLAILAWPLYSAGWPSDPFFTPPKLFLLTLVAVGLPAIHGWTQRNRTDRAIGETSYPIYLGHLLVLGVLSGMPALAGNTVLLTAATMAATFALAWVVVRFLESRIEAVRRRLAQQAGAGGKIG